MELFIGPWNQMANWSVEGMGGSFRFLQRVWTLTQEYLAAQDSGEEHDADSAIENALNKTTHHTIKKVGEDLQHLSFNTAIAALMEMVNELYKIKAQDNYQGAGEAWRFTVESLLQLLAPFAPHIADELWSQIGKQGSIHLSEWPAFDDAYLVQDTMTVVVQVNGKVRSTLVLPVDTTEVDAQKAALDDKKVQIALDGKEVKRVIYVPGKLVSLVI
jgi:leucyl-tRNA synthetase